MNVPYKIGPDIVSALKINQTGGVQYGKRLKRGGAAGYMYSYSTGNACPMLWGAYFIEALPNSRDRCGGQVRARAELMGLFRAS